MLITASLLGPGLAWSPQGGCNLECFAGLGNGRAGHARLHGQPMSPTPHDLAGGRPDGGAADAFWWMYEHVPGVFDPLIRFGRRHVLPLIRGGAEIRRLAGTAGPDARQAVVIAAGASLTLDYLLARIFAAPPAAQAIGSVPLPHLPRHLDAMAADCDLVLASVPRAWGGRFGSNYLRVPALIGASLRVDRGLEIHARGGQPDGSSGSGARAQLRL